MPESCCYFNRLLRKCIIDYDLWELKKTRLTNKLLRLNPLYSHKK